MVAAEAAALVVAVIVVVAAAVRAGDALLIDIADTSGSDIYSSGSICERCCGTCLRERRACTRLMERIVE